ncbi:MAG: hypothetical protein ACI915_003474 [Gammaproteobacteria bacterium]|jgi:hypothetical protein
MISRASLFRFLLIMLLAFSQAALVAHASAPVAPGFSHCNLCLGYEAGSSALNPNDPFTDTISAASTPPRPQPKASLLARPHHYFQSRAPPVFIYSI